MTRVTALAAILVVGIFSAVFTAHATTRDFTDPAAFAAATTNPTTIGFNGILPPGVLFENFNPLIVSGVSFSTPTPGTLVNVTIATFYSPNNYPAAFIVDSTNPSSSNELIIALSKPTFALALVYGGLGFTGVGTGTFTLSNGHVFTQPNLPTVGHTAFVGFVSTDAITTLTLVTSNDSWVAENLVLASATVILPDLSITSVRPVQVVFDADINGDGQMDLVKGKPTSFRARINVRNPELLAPSRLFATTLTFQGQTFTKNLGKFDLDTQGNADLIFEPITPTQVGRDQSVQVDVDVFNSVAEADETNNSRTMLVTVKETKPLRVYFFRVLPKDPGTYEVVSVAEAEETSNNGALFLDGTYPVSSVVSTGTPSYQGDFPEGTSRLCTIPLLCKDDKALLIDYINLFVAAKRIDRSATHAVGIVSQDYLSYHGYPLAAGLAIPGCESTVRGVLVEAGLWIGAAHEIGHTICLQHNNNAATGRWVSKGIDVNAISFMGAGDGAFRNFNRWVDRQDYDTLFRQLRVNPDDPEILLVSGLIRRDGALELTRWYHFEAGSADQPPPGDASIQVLDVSGNVISHVEFQPPFVVEDHQDPVGTRQTDFAGFSLSVAYPSSAAMIRIQRGGVTQMDVNPAIKLLDDAIDSIPVRGFVANPKQRRNALHNEVAAIGEMLGRKAFLGAHQALTNSLKTKFVNWLVDNYGTESPLQMSKNEVLSLVDNIATRILVMSQH